MLVRSVRLNNYRNYSKSRFSFDPHLNIITGPNGAGKTNLLESIVLVSNTRSFRTRDDRDLIKKDEDFARVDLETADDRFRIVISRKNKALFINNEPVRKTSEFIGKLNAVLFKPGDLELFDDPPSVRRRLLDMEIAKVSPRYIDTLLRYNHYLKDKNSLLKEEDIDLTLLKVIDENLTPLIGIITAERERFFAAINRHIAGFYQQISGKAAAISIEYKKCAEDDEIPDKLMDSRSRDLLYRHATFGPHREDYRFLMDGYDLSSIASQGQRRMTVIAFKFALIEYIKEETGHTPVVLLDDILSELDKQNQERLLAIIPQDTQIIITDTDIDGLRITAEYKHIEIKEGDNA